MKSILPSALETRVEVGGRRYNARPTVARVLMGQEALRDAELLPKHGLQLAVWHFYQWPRPKPTEEAVNAFFGLLDEPPAYRRSGGPQTLDWYQDAALLTAAFKQLYGMDLWRECWTLDWRVFMALVSGITDAAALGEVMSIRARKIPKRTQGNGEYIRDLQMQKAIYALRGQHGRGKSYQAGLASLFAALKGMAKPAPGARAAASGQKAENEG